MKYLIYTYREDYEYKEINNVCVVDNIDDARYILMLVKDVIEKDTEYLHEFDAAIEEINEIDINDPLLESNIKFLTQL